MDQSLSVAYKLWKDTAKKLLISYPLLKKSVAVAGIGCCLLVLRNVFIYIRRKWHKHPPTLYGLPIFGSLFTMLHHGSKFNTHILPKYGPIVCHHIGSIFTPSNITINDANLIKAIMQSKYCLDRPKFTQDIFTFQENQKVYQFTMINGEKWSQRRRFIVNSMTSMLNNKHIELELDSMLNHYCYPSIEKILAQNGGVKAEWYPKKDIKFGLFYVLFNGLFGMFNNNNNNNSENETDINQLMNSLDRTIDAIPGKVIGKLFPLIGIFLTKYATKQVNTQMSQFFTIVEKYVNEAFNDDGNNNDDTFIKELFEQHKQEGNNNSREIMDYVKIDLVGMIIPAIDTTASVIEVALLYLAKNESLQGRIRYEIVKHCRKKTDNNNSNNNNSNNNTNSGIINSEIKENKEMESIVLPDSPAFKPIELDLNGISKCVEFRAFIQEILRLSSAVPRSFGRTVSEPCTLAYDVDESLVTL